GSRIIEKTHYATIPVGEAQLGRVLNGLGVPIDKKGEIFVRHEMPLYAEGRNPLERPPIDTPLALGVRAIDGLITLG
ncbi:flagellum-specific ATP synthase FliI, partial [Vibrio parahaemolyticus]